MSCHMRLQYPTYVRRRANHKQTEYLQRRSGYGEFS
jgi:hypothetical protein